MTKWSHVKSELRAHEPPHPLALCVGDVHVRKAIGGRVGERLPGRVAAGMAQEQAREEPLPGPPLVVQITHVIATSKRGSPAREFVQSITTGPSGESSTLSG